MLPGTTSWCKPFTFCLYHTHVAGTKVICFSASVIYWNQTKSTVLLSPVSFPCFSFMGFFFGAIIPGGLEGWELKMYICILVTFQLKKMDNFWPFTCSHLEIPFVFPFPLPWFQLFSCTLIFSLLKSSSESLGAAQHKGWGVWNQGTYEKKSNYES